MPVRTGVANKRDSGRGSPDHDQTLWTVSLLVPLVMLLEHKRRSHIISEASSFAVAFRFHVEAMLIFDIGPRPKNAIREN